MDQNAKQENIRKAEEMLIRYIQERRKPMAALALETLLEIAPDHPRRQELEIWVRDLDQEVAFRKQLSDLLARGRASLQRGDLADAREALDKLQQLDPDGQDGAALIADLDRNEQGQAAIADIGRIKQRVEDMLEAGNADGAAAELEELARHEVPKITLDFLHQRLGELRAKAEGAQALATLESSVRECLVAQDWQGARDIAYRIGEQFRGNPRSAELLNEINQRESEHRRQQSLSQGIQTLQGFIAQGRKSDAQLALKLLRNLKIDAERLQAFETQVRQM